MRFLGFLEGLLWESFESWCVLFLELGVGWDGRSRPTGTSQIVKSSILHVTRIYSMYSMNIYKGITGFNYIYVAYRTD